MNARLAIVRVGALHAFAWRLDVLHAVVSAAVVGWVSVALWTKVAAGQGAVGTLTGPQVPVYAALAWTVSRVTATRLDANLGQRVASGQVVMDLLKPVDLTTWLLLRDGGRALATAVVVGVPLSFGALLLGVPLAPASAAHGLAGAGALMLGVRMAGLVAVAVGLLARRLRRADGVVGLKDLGVAVLSGALVPLPLLPEGVGAVLGFLPSASLAHVPVMLWLGVWSWAWSGWVLLVQCGWLLAADVAVHALWRAERPLLVLEGG